jgi:hypothetical protein
VPRCPARRPCEAVRTLDQLAVRIRREIDWLLANGSPKSSSLLARKTRTETVRGSRHRAFSMSLFVPLLEFNHSLAAIAKFSIAPPYRRFLTRSKASQPLSHKASIASKMVSPPRLLFLPQKKERRQSGQLKRDQSSPRTLFPLSSNLPHFDEKWRYIPLTGGSRGGRFAAHYSDNAVCRVQLGSATPMHFANFLQLARFADECSGRALWPAREALTAISSHGLAIKVPSRAPRENALCRSSCGRKPLQRGPGGIFRSLAALR